MLYPLIPKPIDVKNDTFSGKLLVDGNIINNLLLFKFHFDFAESMSPVCIHIEVLEKKYQYFCNIRDFTNPVMKTQIIKPEFNMENNIKILKIEPLVTFSGKNLVYFPV